MSLARIEYVGSVPRAALTDDTVHGRADARRDPAAEVCADDGAANAEPSEQALIEATRRGDSAAFDRLVERHISRALAVACRLLGRREDAEDVVQEAFVAALVKLDAFDAARPFAPWLLRIVANRALNLRKARTLRQAEEIPADTRSSAASPFDEAARLELREELQRALAALPEVERWVVELFDVDGFTGPEIAQMLDMPEGTVRWHLHEGRRRLRVSVSHLQRKLL